MENQILHLLQVFISTLYRIIIFLIFARVILSWMRPSHNAFTRFIIDTTEPILRQAKRITPNLGPLDISPIIAFIAIEIIYMLLLQGIQFIASII